MKNPPIASALRWSLPLTIGLAVFAQNATQIQVLTGSHTRSITIYHLPPGPADPNSDLDQNGLPDAWEQEHFGNTGADPDADSDHDGLSNRREVQYGSDPRVADSDHDGVSDGQEVADATDPNDASSGRYARVIWQTTHTTSGFTPIVTTPGPGVPGYTYTQNSDNGRRYRKITVTRTVTGDPHDNNGTFLVTATNLPETGNWLVDGNPYGELTLEELAMYYFYPPVTSQYFRNNYPEIPITETRITAQTAIMVDYYGAGNFGDPIGRVLNTVITEYELSELEEPIRTGGVAYTDTYPSNQLPEAARSGSNVTSVSYHLEVPAEMTGTLRWLEIFTPAGNPDGRDFKAHSWSIDGTTSPQFELSAPTDGSATLQFFSAELAVDANRDGQIKFASEDQSDATASAHPLVFWTNSNRDGNSSIPGEQDVQDDLAPSGGPPDFEGDRILYTRDLEDWTRIRINLNGLRSALSSRELKLGLVWNHVSANSPALKLVQAVEPDGGLEYLTDLNIARQQTMNIHAVKLGSVDSREGVYVFPDYVLSSLESDTVHLLLEGASRGAGELQWVLLKSDAQSLIDIGPGVWMELKSIKELYERWTVGDGPDGAGGGAPSQIASIATARVGQDVVGLKYTPESLGLSEPTDPHGNKYILYVHGWNMHPWEKDAFAETMFKRLYWQGYKGKFGAFQWPTTYHDHDIAAVFDYDDGEYSAWRSAAPLETLLENLNRPGAYPGNVYLLAHSMGNVVAGEALRIGAQVGAGNLVDTYIASQAAVPAHCYDPTLSGTDLLDFDAAGILGPQTPNIYDEWLSPSSHSAVAEVNFHNANDYALAIWQTNQKLKPDVRIFTYYYDSTNLSTVQDLFRKAVSRIGGIGVVSLHLGDATSVHDRYEIMAYAAEARSKALGTVATVAGFNSQNLPSFWPSDTFPQTNGGYSSHPWHSAQFRFSNSEQARYWSQFLKLLGLPTIR